MPITTNSKQMIYILDIGGNLSMLQKCDPQLILSLSLSLSPIPLLLFFPSQMGRFPQIRQFIGRFCSSRSSRRHGGCFKKELLDLQIRVIRRLSSWRHRGCFKKLLILDRCQLKMLKNKTFSTLPLTSTLWLSSLSSSYRCHCRRFIVAIVVVLTLSLSLSTSSYFLSSAETSRSSFQA